MNRICFTMLSLLAVPAGALLAVPKSPEQMVASAAAGIRRARDTGCLRQIVNIVVPLPTTVLREGKSVWDQDDPIDPWPGGLKQQYPYAVDLGRSIMQQVVGAAKSAVNDQVLDAEDACGLIMAQGGQPSEDSALVLFPGCDQLDLMEKVDKMCGERLLVLLNPQFRRPGDFGLFQRKQAASAYFDRGYQTSFSFEEFACRGEDVKLVGEWDVENPRWRAFVMLSDEETDGRPLHDGELPDRPAYTDLERMINERYPTPRWARMLDEVDAKGLRFMRKGDAAEE